MPNYEWLEACRERGRRGGLKTARLRLRLRREREYGERKERDASNAMQRKLKRELAEQEQEYCSCCDQRIHNGICPRCDTY